MVVPARATRRRSARVALRLGRCRGGEKKRDEIRCGRRRRRARTHLSCGSFSGSTILAWSPSLSASLSRHRLSDLDAWRNVAHVASARAKSESPRNPNTSRSTCAGTLSRSMLGWSCSITSSADSDRIMRPSAVLFHPVRALMARDRRGA